MPGIVRVPSIYNGRRAGVPVFGTPGNLPRILREASAWYDTRDLSSTGQQTLSSRVSGGVAQLGSTAGSDTNDPLVLPGSGYVYLPGTASNNLSIPKDGGWAGTLHVTGTLTDDTTATFTTTASPILIGNTLIAAGRYKKFVVRDTDGNGTVRVTIEPSVETLGQVSWTCTTGQTVTVNRSTSGLTTAVVTRPLLMADGTDDYLQLPAGDTPSYTATTGAYTALVVARLNDGAAFQFLFDGQSGGGNGAVLFIDASGVLSARTGGASTSVTSTIGTGLDDRALRAFGYVQSAGAVAAYESTVGMSATSSTAAVGAITHQTPRALMPAYTILFPARAELMATVVWTRALTAAELNAASAYLLGSYA